MNSGAFRARLRALAAKLARGERPALSGAPAPQAASLPDVWPARRGDGFWLAAPPWPDGYPAPDELSLRTVGAATALDAESLGRTPKPLCVVGLAHITAAGVALEQYVAAHTDEEGAVVARAAALLNDPPLLVTYNGLTFDLPLLRDRAAYWRLAAPPAPRRHLNLLRVVRAGYKRRLNMPRCALADAERYILGLARPADISSAQVPELYERAVRAGDARPLVPLLRHNLYDLAGLTLLYLKIARDDPAWLEVEPAAPAPTPGEPLF